MSLRTVGWPQQTVTRATIHYREQRVTVTLYTTADRVCGQHFGRWTRSCARTSRTKQQCALGETLTCRSCVLSIGGSVRRRSRAPWRIVVVVSVGVGNVRRRHNNIYRSSLTRRRRRVLSCLNNTTLHRSHTRYTGPWRWGGGGRPCFLQNPRQDSLSAIAGGRDPRLRRYRYFIVLWPRADSETGPDVDNHPIVSAKTRSAVCDTPTLCNNIIIIFIIRVNVVYQSDRFRKRLPIFRVAAETVWHRL